MTTRPKTLTDAAEEYERKISEHSSTQRASEPVTKSHHASATPEFMHASGDCICQQCDRIYYDHPADVLEPFLNVLCDGTRVKL